MTQLHYQHIVQELENIRTHLDSLFQRLHETNSSSSLPDSSEPVLKMLPTVQGNLRVDVMEHDDEVIVKADMIVGDQKKDIKLDLIDSQALKIFCERKTENSEGSENYSMCERNFGSMTRIVPLPKPVTEDGSHALFKDGILEVHLKKEKSPAKGNITIE